MIETEKGACATFVEISYSCLGNQNSWKPLENNSKPIFTYKRFERHYEHKKSFFRLVYRLLSKNHGIVLDNHCEMFNQDILQKERRYKGKWQNERFQFAIGRFVVKHGLMTWKLGRFNDNFTALTFVHYTIIVNIVAIIIVWFIVC